MSSEIPTPIPKPLTQEIQEAFRLHVEKRIAQIAKEIPIQKEKLETTSATRLLEKRKEIHDVELNLAQQREEYKAKSAAIAQRREELVRRETQLKDALIKFEKYLKENDVKKERAYKKAQDEKRFKEAKEIEIKELTQEIQIFLEIKENQVKKTEELMKYHEYLEYTLELIPDYGDIKDIISRYETLKQTNIELMERAAETQLQTEHIREQFVQLKANQQRMILLHNNTLAKTKTNIEDVQTKNFKALIIKENISKVNQEKSLQISQIKMAIANLFGIAQMHLKNKIHSQTDPVAQLKEVEQFYVDTCSITDDLKNSL